MPFRGLHFTPLAALPPCTFPQTFISTYYMLGTALDGMHTRLSEIFTISALKRLLSDGEIYKRRGKDH